MVDQEGIDHVGHHLQHHLQAFHRSLASRHDQPGSKAMMGRSVMPSTEGSTAWLADLIKATELVASTAKPCDPATLRAFGHRLGIRVDVQPPVGVRQ